MREDYYSYLSEFAHFSGTMEIPIIHKPERMVIPKRIVPFSQRNRCNPDESFVCFYEDDKLFIDFLNHPEAYLEDLKRFLGVITPDPSLNTDMPLVVQLYNVYIAREALNKTRHFRRFQLKSDLAFFAEVSNGPVKFFRFRKEFTDKKITQSRISRAA